MQWVIVYIVHNTLPPEPQLRVKCSNHTINTMYNIYNINTINTISKCQQKMRFKRICIRCEKYFRPTGKENKICEKCKRNNGSQKNKK